LLFRQDDGSIIARAGELVVTDTGLEGGPVYALSSRLRRRLAVDGVAGIWLDLCPDLSQERLESALREPQGRRSLSGYLKRKTGLDGIKQALLRECLPPDIRQHPPALAAAIKQLPLSLTAPGPLATAISTAGGVQFEALDAGLMLRTLPGVFVAGEMLDYDAPTGGYLLTACLATGRMAGRSAAEWLIRQGTG
jgi:predicted flavoprotein YhiN